MKKEITFFFCLDSGRIILKYELHNVLLRLISVLKNAEKSLCEDQNHMAFKMVKFV